MKSTRLSIEQVKKSAAKQNGGSDLYVAYSARPEIKTHPPVFHMQHSLKYPYQAAGVLSRRQLATNLSSNNAFFLWSRATAALLTLFPLQAALAEDEPMCLDYYTVGESECRPAASTPIASSAQTTVAQEPEASPAKQKSAVDEYLENYGKPPREFVEFYLNPTTENANKWMQTYRGMLQKGEDLSKAWQDADQLYTAVPVPNSSLSPVQKIAASKPAITVNSAISRTAVNKPQQVVSPSNFGAFSVPIDSSSIGLGGVRTPSLSLTYYFSQTCPYCARMTPQLAELSSKTKSKLVFTCVDVTPLGASSRPVASNITSKLPCKWRLPEAGEVEREGVQQTPTLLIQKEGKEEVRLSGYVPLAQLEQYF